MNLKICILLPWDINNDSRAQRTALTLSLYHKVHVFHIAEKNTISELLSSIEITKIPPVNRTVKDRFFLPFHASSRALKEKLITCVNNYNVIYCHDLPALFALKGIDLKNQKIVYDIHDLYLETIYQSLAPAGSSQAQKIKHKIAIFLFRFFIKI